MIYEIALESIFMQSTPIKALVRFGPYELDLSTADLSGKGKKLRLPEQQFLILEMLLEAGGTLVSREEIRKRLWSDNTMVEFDQSINAAIKKLRAALGDSADSPRYIETVARRGYRMLVTVETPGESQGAPVANVAQISESASVPEMQSPSAEDTPTRKIGRQWLAVSASLVLAGIGAGYVSYTRAPLVSPHVESIVRVFSANHGQQVYPVGADGQHLYVETFHRPCLNSLDSVLTSVGIRGDSKWNIPLTVPWHHDACTALESMSPDNSYLLGAGYDGEGDKTTKWLFSLSGTPIRSLTVPRLPLSFPNTKWTPDGKNLIYATSDGSIAMSPIAGGDSRVLASRLSSDGRPPDDPSMSPDGKLIRFMRGDGIWQISADGSGLHKILKGMPRMCCGEWTPDGDLYIFMVENTLDTGQIWALDERRGFSDRSSKTPIQLTSEPIEWQPPFVISEDGKTIYANSVIKQGELTRFDRTTGHFNSFLNGISAEWLEFSPDGKHVAYISYPDRKVWQADSDGSQKVLLAEPEGQAYGVRWSPDGTRILFGTLIFSQNREEVYTVPVGGGKLETVSLPGTINTSDPTWAPDSNRIAYAANDGGTELNEIRIYDLHSKTYSALPKPFRPTYFPRWSPNGRYIVAFSYQTGYGFKVLPQLFDFKAKKWSIYPKGLDLHYANWSRDSKSIYFIEADGVGPSTIRRMLIPSGKVEFVASLRDLKTAGGFGGTWLGLDPHDMPLILHDISTKAIYSISIARN